MTAALSNQLRYCRDRTDRLSNIVVPAPRVRNPVVSRPRFFPVYGSPPALIGNASRQIFAWEWDLETRCFRQGGQEKAAGVCGGHVRPWDETTLGWKLLWDRSCPESPLLMLIDTRLTSLSTFRSS